MTNTRQLVADDYVEFLTDDYFQEYYGYSDFMNYGFWREDTTSAKEASENLMEELLAFIPEKTGVILDVACGKGATTRHITRYYKPEHVMGINISNEQLEICKKNAPQAHFLMMDATVLGFDNASVDNVISVEAVHHFDTRRKFLEEAYRILKPGGRVILSDPLTSRLVFRSNSIFPKANYLKDIAAYRTLLRQVGFHNVMIRDETLACWIGCCNAVNSFFKNKWQRGEASYSVYKAWTRWNALKTRHTLYYLLLAAQKPGAPYDKSYSRRTDFVPRVNRLGQAPQSRLLLAQAYFTNHDYEHAIEECGAALALNPGFTSAKMLVVECRKALRGDPDYPHETLKLGELPTWQDLYEACDAERGEPEARLHLAEDFYKTRQYERAVTQCNSALELDPGNATSHMLLARIHFSLGRYREAARACHSALESGNDPISASAHLILALIHRERGEYAQATAACRKGCELAPQQPALHHLLGDVCFSQKHYEEAALAFTCCLELTPRAAAAHYKLANVYLAQGKKAEATAQMEAALRSRPSSPRSHLALGDVRFAGGEVSAAVAEYREAWTLNPKLGDAYQKGAAALFELEQYTEAKLLCRVALSINRRSAEAHRLLGDICSKLEQVGDGLSRYDAALDSERVEEGGTSPAPGESSSNRRQHERHRLNLPVELGHVDGEVSAAVSTNVSRFGLLIESERDIEPDVGSHISIETGLHQDGRPVSLIGEVAWLENGKARTGHRLGVKLSPVAGGFEFWEYFVTG